MEKELLELYLDGMDIVLLSSHLNLNPVALGSACLRGCFLELQLKITTICPTMGWMSMASNLISFDVTLRF